MAQKGNKNAVKHGYILLYTQSYFNVGIDLFSRVIPVEFT